ncbi:hypothetical protein MHJ63_09195 [Pseudoglutamicibacter albus]|uniref:hypothetical protein n=1 Tax=Pseudoglutamicibacter albus TaxID=98671 RepID=UPI001EF73301|nr:hypothetical protein [Pseudoglutamicibacter albus]MCG7305437.1 hypothetical protein [Pseudoglutamicibacter albus]
MNALKASVASHAHSKESQRRWPTLFLVLLALCSLVLTACSVDITTTQKMDANGKGTRSMTVVAELSKKEAGKVDVKKIEKTLKKAAPEGTKVDSVKKKGRKLTVSVTMSFKDIEDYKKVLNNALDAGGLSPSVRVDFESINAQLRHGLTLEENVSSGQLLQWVRKALLDNKIVSKKKADAVSPKDRGGTLSVGNESTKAPRTPFQESKVTDHGFIAVTPLIEKRTDGYRFAVVYRVESGSREAEKAREKWIDSVMPDGAQKVELPGSVGTDREHIAVVMDVKDETELKDALGALLGDKNLEVSITDLDEPEGLFTRVYEYTLEADCSQICEGGSSIPLRPYVSTPGVGTDGYKYPNQSTLDELGFTDGAIFTAISEVSSDNRFHALDVKPMKMTSITALLKPGVGDKVSFEVAVAVPESELGTEVEKLEKAFTPSNGSLTSEKKDDQRVFTFTWEGKNPEELERKVQVTFKSFSMQENRGGGLWPESTVQVDFAPERDLNTTISSIPTLKVELPLMHGVKGGVPEDGFGLHNGHAEFAYSGPALAWIITMGVLLFIVIAAIVLLVVFRKKIAAKLKSAGEGNRDGHSSQVNVYNTVRAQYNPPAPPAGDAGPPAPPADSTAPPAPPAPPGDSPAPPAPTVPPAPPVPSTEDAGPPAPPPLPEK